MPRIVGHSDTYDFVYLPERGAWALQDAAGVLHPEIAIPIPQVRMLPSVTTVTDQLTKGGALTGWAFKLGIQAVLDLQRQGRNTFGADAQRIREWAKWAKLRTPWSNSDTFRGEQAHDILEKLATGEWFTDRAYAFIDKHVAEENRGYCEAVVNWWVESGKEPGLTQASEGKVWSLREGGFSGTLDLLYDNELIDLKTRPADKPAVYDENRYQVSGYDLAVRDSMGITPLGHTILTAHDDGTYDSTPIRLEHDIFLELVRLWWARQRAKDSASR